MRSLRVQNGQVVVEAIGLLPLVALVAAVSLDCGMVLADRIAVTRVATAAAMSGSGDDSRASSARDAAPDRLTKSLKTRTVKGQVVVSAQPRTLVLGRFTNLTVRSTVDLPDSPEVTAL
jgi:hypothetical protein